MINYSSIEIRTVLLSIVPSISIMFLHQLINTIIGDSYVNQLLYLLIIGFIFTMSNIVCLITLFSMIRFDVYWRSSLIMNVFTFGLMIFMQNSYSQLKSFGVYFMILSFFHLSEYVFTALFNYNKLKIDSFLLNHSREYYIAMVSSWCEYLIEVFIWPELKCVWYLQVFGLGMILFGEIFRKLAMYTAGTNFNHLVQEKKANDHVLVDYGIYAIVRHPSYFGWFYWSIGTQILLANPLCTLAYTYASWSFFSGRILYEEFYLKKFFGRKYIDYQKRVPIGIPFIKGHCDYDESLD